MHQNIMSKRELKELGGIKCRQCLLSLVQKVMKTHAKFIKKKESALLVLFPFSAPLCGCNSLVIFLFIYAFSP